MFKKYSIFYYFTELFDRLFINKPKKTNLYSQAMSSARFACSWLESSGEEPGGRTASFQGPFSMPSGGYDKFENFWINESKDWYEKTTSLLEFRESSSFEIKNLKLIPLRKPKWSCCRRIRESDRDCTREFGWMFLKIN